MKLALALLLTLVVTGAPRRKVIEKFTIGEPQLNDFLRAELRSQLRPGIEAATLKLFPANYVSIYCTINFDDVERLSPGTIPIWLRIFLRGRKSLLVDFRFESAEGVFTYKIEKAYFQDTKLPPALVESIIEILAARQPERFDVTKPLPLPFGVRRAWTGNRALYCER